MSLIERMRKQKAVYWGPPTPDGIGGSTFPEPVEIKCRWENISERFLTPEVKEEVSKAKVYTDRDVEVGGWLGWCLLSEIDEVEAGDPRLLSVAWPIRAFHKMPNMKAKKFLRTAFL